MEIEIRQLAGSAVAKTETCPHCCGTGRVLATPAEVLRAARRLAGLKLREIAEALGLSMTYASEMEHGRRRVEPQRIIAWLKACGQKGAWPLSAAEAAGQAARQAHFEAGGSPLPTADEVYGILAAPEPAGRPVQPPRVGPGDESVEDCLAEALKKILAGGWVLLPEDEARARVALRKAGRL